jgi:hypothetical protein
LDPDYEWFYDDDDGIEYRKLVEIDIHKFDIAWKHGIHKDQYISEKGIGGIKGRYQNFGKWLGATNIQIEASTVSVDTKGNISFINGRHRYSWLRDSNADSIQVAMDKISIKNAKKFGLIK